MASAGSSRTADTIGGFIPTEEVPVSADLVEGDVHRLLDREADVDEDRRRQTAEELGMMN
jgi:hypothetical protein